MSTRQTVTIDSLEDRLRIAAWAKNVERGTVVTFRKKSRSSEQNAKLHAMLGEVAKQVSWFGQYLDLEDWKDMFTASLRHARVVPGIDKGTFVPLGMHTSTLTIEEMSNLIELIYAFGADPEHPVVFKDPKEHESGSSPLQPDASEQSPAALAEPADVALQSAGSPLTQYGWLIGVSKMLWDSTSYGGEINELKISRQAVWEAFKEPPSQECADKANGVYGYCRQVILKEMSKADGLAMVAGVVGCDQHEIGGAI